MTDDIDAAEEWVLPPERRRGTFFVYDLAGAHDRLPEMLELIAVCCGAAPEYQLEQIAVATDELGWSTASVTVQELRPGHLIQQPTEQGDTELAAKVAALVRDHRIREGLRRAGVTYQ